MMGLPVSTFFMDVRGSSRFVETQVLEAYLEQRVDHLKVWTSGIVRVDAVYRHGDEIFLVANHFSTAFLLAYYIRATWAYPEHPPYFGLSYGMVDEWSQEKKMETWVHPMFKAARRAMNQLKTPNERQGSMCFESSDPRFDFSVTQMNHWLWVEREWFAAQSAHQQLASHLYAVYGVQHKVADVLGKDRSTISRILNRGNASNLLKVSDIIETLLQQDEGVDAIDEVRRLREQICQQVATTHQPMRL